MEEELEEYLNQRNISLETINYMKNEKVDCKVLTIMDDGKLTTLIPRYGDRVAVVDFCKRRLSSNSTRKQGLLDKLRKKFKRNANGSDDEEERIIKKDNPKKFTRSVKPTRLIELGWLHKDSVHEPYRQVRARTGGGTRQIHVPKSFQKKDLMDTAKQLFFPGGKSARGNEICFDFDIFDFQHNPLTEELTVQEIFETTGLTRVAFYLASSKNKELPATVTSSDSVNSEVSHIPAYPSSASTPAVVPSEITQTNYLGDEQYFGSYQTNIVHEHFQSFQELDSIYTAPPVNVNVPDDILAVSGSDIPASNKSQKLIVHRGHVLDELISAFEELDKDCGPIYIEMILPNGESEKAIDTGGVYRDCLSEFWSTFYDKCTLGTRFKIPVLRHDYGHGKWQAVAKIIYRGWKDIQYLPIKLAPPFLELCLTGKVEGLLTPSFLKYVGCTDEGVLSMALQTFNEVDFSDLIEILDTFECKRAPSVSNINQIIEEIAHKELIQKPMFIVDIWQQELQGLLTCADLQNTIKKMIPITKNILNLLETEEAVLDTNSVHVFGFLKKFLREAESNILTSFLRFCTGSDIIVYPKIIVAFCKREGLLRIPTAHTCSYTLELPINYDNYPDFKAEMNSVLTSNMWVMDMP